MDIFNYMIELEDELAKSVAADTRALGKFPEGRLQCNKNGTHYNWFRSNAGTGRQPIYKKDAALAEELARKGVIEDSIKINQRRLKAVRMFLRHFDTSIPGESYMNKNPEYRRLATTHINQHGYSDTEWAWMMATRPYAQKHPERLTVPCTLILHFSTPLPVSWLSSNTSV